MILYSALAHLHINWDLILRGGLLLLRQAS